MQFWILSLVPAIAIFAQDYVYHEIDGDIWKQKLNFSLVAIQFTGIIFYAKGHDYQYSVRFADSNSTDKLLTHHYKFNKQYHYTSYHNISCSCNNCSSIYLTFKFIDSYTSDSFTCNNKSNIIKWSFESNGLSPFVGFPIPQNLKKTFIWIGNISPYINRSISFYSLNKHQLVGCIDSLYSNEKALQISAKGKYFLSCTKSIPETICQKQICYSKTKSVKLFECHWPVLNDGFCKNEVSEYTIKSKRLDYISHTFQPITFGLKWKQKKISFQCLMEIQLKDGSVLLLTVNTQGYLVLLKRQIYSTLFEPIVLNKTSNNFTNVLFIEIYNGNISIAMYDQNEIHRYINQITAIPKLINVGFTNIVDICMKFEGSIELEFDSAQFKVNDMKSSYSEERAIISLFKENHLKIVFFSLSVFLVAIIITVSLVYVCKINKPPKINTVKTIDWKTTQNIPLESINDNPYGVGKTIDWSTFKNIPLGGPVNDTYRVVNESSGYTYF